MISVYFIDQKFIESVPNCPNPLGCLESMSHKIPDSRFRHRFEQALSSLPSRPLRPDKTQMPIEEIIDRQRAHTYLMSEECGRIYIFYPEGSLAHPFSKARFVYPYNLDPLFSVSLLLAISEHAKLDNPLFTDEIGANRLAEVALDYLAKDVPDLKDSRTQAPERIKAAQSFIRVYNELKRKAKNRGLDSQEYFTLVLALASSYERVGLMQLEYPNFSQDCHTEPEFAEPVTAETPEPNQHSGKSGQPRFILAEDLRKLNQHNLWEIVRSFSKSPRLYSKTIAQFEQPSLIFTP